MIVDSSPPESSAFFGKKIIISNDSSEEFYFCFFVHEIECNKMCSNRLSCKGISVVTKPTTVKILQIGENLYLDIGREVKEWKRIRDGAEETIRPCLGNKDRNCSIWIDKVIEIQSKKKPFFQNLLPAGDGREHMYVNGTLVIDNFQNTDSGDYYSDDELERVIISKFNLLEKSIQIHYTTDGQIWKLARSRISVFPIE